MSDRLSSVSRHRRDDTQQVLPDNNRPCSTTCDGTCLSRHDLDSEKYDRALNLRHNSALENLSCKDSSFLTGLVHATGIRTVVEHVVHGIADCLSVGFVVWFISWKKFRNIVLPRRFVSC